jgi:hypothetical protein
MLGRDLSDLNVKVNPILTASGAVKSRPEPPDFISLKNGEPKSW